MILTAVYTQVTLHILLYTGVVDSAVYLPLAYVKDNYVCVVDTLQVQLYVHVRYVLCSYTMPCIHLKVQSIDKGAQLIQKKEMKK